MNKESFWTNRVRELERENSYNASWARMWKNMAYYILEESQRTKRTDFKKNYLRKQHLFKKFHH